MISAHIIRASAIQLQSSTYLNLGLSKSIIMSLSKTVERSIFISTMDFIHNLGLAILMDGIEI